MNVYINYPNRQITIHSMPTCNCIQRSQKPNQRKLEIYVNNCEMPLNDFFGNRIKFESNSDFNDLWLVIDFADRDFEICLVQYLRRLIISHYPSFAGSEIKFHC
jgi:hypothetical protein